MGCIDVKITIVNTSIAFDVRRIGGIDVYVRRIGEPLMCSVFDVLKKDHLKLHCGIVCTVENMHYLRVSPQDIQWITPEVGVVYYVESDVSWTVLVNN